MLKKIYTDYGILIFLCIGIALRFLTFYISPPSNSYDNHLEVIHTYFQEIERPLPFSCWECYQPPIYYSLSAFVYGSMQYLEISKDASWKIVQLINPILSILVLFLAFKILNLFGINKGLKILYLSFIVVLPRDIFTSVMIGNDYLLVFLSIASLYFYLRYVLLGNKIHDYVYMSFFVVLGGLTKQHGLLLLLFPGIILIYNFKKSKKGFKISSIFISILILLISEEAWKFYHTGVFMVSNQHYFDYAVNQFPGQLEKVEFISFRLLNLFKEPFISNMTAASFPTEIFARIFFDYEYRFFSPKIEAVNNFARLGYVLGIIWFLFFTITSWLRFKFIKIKKREVLTQLIPFLLCFLFALVPVIQTVRYPYFSSMKAMFLLPGIVIFIINHANYIKEIKINSILITSLTVLNLAYGIIFICIINNYVEVSLDNLHGPMWPMP